MSGSVIDPDAIDRAAFKPGDRPEGLDGGPALTLTRFPAPYRWATRGVHQTLSWDDVVALAVEPELWPGAGTTESASQRLPALTFARYRDDTRVVTRDQAVSDRETRVRVVEVHGLILDYVDEPAVDAEHLRRWWGRHGFIAHTTGFHQLPMGERPPGPRWRVLIPLTRAVDLDTAIALAAWARHPRHDTGIIADTAEHPWRATPVPAVGPGGYRWFATPGPALDPHQALSELATWRQLDTRTRAEQALEGTQLRLAAERLAARHRTPRLRPHYPLPPLPVLQDHVGALWPGRVLGLLGASGSGRTHLALQIAAQAAARGLPVLLVLLRMGADEAAARLLAHDLGQAASDSLSGRGTGVEEAVMALPERFPALHLWAPRASERDLDHLLEKVRATSEAHGDVPPLVLVDGVEGWGVHDPEAGARELAAGLRDASHAGTLAPTWPGAAVVLVGGLPYGRLTPSALRAEVQDGRLRLGPHAYDCGVIVVVALEGTDGLVVVAKNRDGSTGQCEVCFDPPTGRFHAIELPSSGG